MQQQLQQQLQQQQLHYLAQAPAQQSPQFIQIARPTGPFHTLAGAPGTGLPIQGLNPIQQPQIIFNSPFYRILPQWKTSDVESHTKQKKILF